jgi:hypothetical protein
MNLDKSGDLIPLNRDNIFLTELSIVKSTYYQRRDIVHIYHVRYLVPDTLNAEDYIIHVNYRDDPIITPVSVLVNGVDITDSISDRLRTPLRFALEGRTRPTVKHLSLKYDELFEQIEARRSLVGLFLWTFEKSYASNHGPADLEFYQDCCIARNWPKRPKFDFIGGATTWQIGTVGYLKWFANLPRSIDINVALQLFTKDGDEWFPWTLYAQITGHHSKIVFLRFKYRKTSVEISDFAGQLLDWRFERVGYKLYTSIYKRAKDILIGD